MAKKNRPKNINIQQKNEIEQLPKWKKLFFRIVLFSIPLITILALEITLRFFDYGGYPPHIREAGLLDSGEKLCFVEPAAFKPYFYANPSRPGYTDQSSFVMPKPSNTIRVFIIGESAAKGYPQPKNLSMASFLQEMMKDLLKDKKIEVISLGTTAVASFPLTYIVRDALKFDPDLFIFYTGNNEFFGAYGTASINSFGTFPPWSLPIIRWIYGLATVQFINEFIFSNENENRTLMEQMINKVQISHNNPLRNAAVENLKYNLSKMVEEVKNAGIPLLLCTTTSNESGLAPLGEDDLSSIDKINLDKFNNLVNRSNSIVDSNYASSIEYLEEALKIVPHNARVHFSLGKLYSVVGDKTKAQKHFRQARNFDTMPWRPTDELENAIREVAKNKNVLLCDIANEFRKISVNNSIGWDLVDDHVHLSIKGQAEAARQMVYSISNLKTYFQIDKTSIQNLSDWNFYADRLGRNIYDDYRVNHTLRVLFNIPFMLSSNNEAFIRYNSAVTETEKFLTPELLKEAKLWQTEKPHAGGLRPITGMIARAMVRENRLDEAITLFQIAQKQVPEYSSWYLEYVYFYLAIKEKINGVLLEADRITASDAISQGLFLLKRGFSESGFTERYIGRLYQLRNEWGEAIPYLLAARTKMYEEDLFACDQALIASYLKVGNRSAATSIIDEGIRDGGRFSNMYLQIKKNISGLGNIN